MRGLCFRGEVATGGWGPERADEGRKMQVSSSIPWQLLGVAGGQNKSVLVLEPVESQGGRMGSTEKKNEHVPPHPFTQRLRSLPPLLRSSGRERPIMTMWWYCHHMSSSDWPVTNLSKRWTHAQKST